VEKDSDKENEMGEACSTHGEMEYTQ